MTQDIEQLAQQLEQHPDYRVLRRLVPGRVFNTPAPGQKLSKGVVLDTETTGFDVAQDRVIELGMLAFEFDPVTGVVYRVSDVFDELEDPGFAIPPLPLPCTTSPTRWCKATALTMPALLSF